MNRRSNHSCIITMTILAVLVLAPMASEADPPSADLAWGTYVCDPYSTEGAGPDAIRVEALRKITPEIAFAFPDDGIQINATEEKGFDITAANATGRGAGAKVVYVVFGLFVRDAGGQGQQAPIPTSWEADFRPIPDPVVLVLRDINSPVGTFDGESGEPGWLYCKPAGDLKGDVAFWLTLTQDSGPYPWTIKDSNAAPTDPPVASGNLTYAKEPVFGVRYWDSGHNLAVGAYTLTVTKAGGFEREIDFAVVSVTLYKLNTIWSPSFVLRPTPDLFTVDRIAGIRIRGPGAYKEIKAKMWTDADPNIATSHTDLLEDPAGDYRNTDTGRWPRFYLEYQANEQRLKIVDEAEKLHVYPMISDVNQEHLEVSEKVDLAEVAVMDATATDDAKAFYDRMTADGSGDPCWAGVGKYIWSVVGDRINITDDNCVAFGKKADILYIAGHGVSSKPGVYGAKLEDDPQRQHALGNYDATPDDPKGFQPSDIAGDWNNGELEWFITAVCSQLYNTNGDSPPPTDNVVKWVKAMPKVHGHFGYRYGAPGGGIDAVIAKRFVSYTKTMTFVEAWMEANFAEGYTPGDYDPWNAGVLVQTDCIMDQWKAAFPTQDGTTYTYYWIDKDKNGDGTKGDGEIKHYPITIP